MANNYLEASETIVLKEDAEVQWWQRKFAEWAKKLDDVDRGDVEDEDREELASYYFDYEESRDESTKGFIWIHGEEYINIDVVADVMQQYLKEFHPKDCFTLTWASYCSKPRVGEFGGGGLVVTADETHFMNAHVWVEQKVKELRARNGLDNE